MSKQTKPAEPICPICGLGHIALLASDISPQDLSRIDFSKNTGRYNSFPLRVARLFNTLPANILQATNRNTFASRVWKHITLTDDTPH